MTKKASKGDINPLRGFDIGIFCKPIAMAIYRKVKG
jgi:hypothetical protein